ncbi:MAG: 30S ribosomal protein S16 [Alphaproteobacteria bacterium]|nr:30S ribosomal protein S16 [Alphaproteobacteria bacterium]
MALSIRMTRGGRKNRPHYKIVVADKRMPRDGRFLEKLGTYDPLQSDNSETRVTLNVERINHWLSEGAQPTDRVARLLFKAGVGPKVTWSETPKKSAPKAKTVERNREKEEKQKAAAEAAEAAAAEAKAAKEAPAPVEEAAPAAAEEAPAAEAAAEGEAQA